MTIDLIEKGYIPLDKSWHIRMAVLDLLKGYDDSIQFLAKYRINHPNQLSDDLEATLRASLQWKSGEQVGVGESATLYRTFWYASNKLGLDKKFERRGTLLNRDLGDTAEKLSMTLEELTALDSSQWATAYVLTNYVLTGKLETFPTDKNKLQVTFDAVKHWDTRKHGVIWEPKYDGTILVQASAYLQWLKEGKMNFTPQQAEDYCFARTFGIMNAKDGRRIWPNLTKHESNRILEMEDQLQRDVITSKDHRIVQSIAMLKRGKVKILHPNSVNKSWPQFWRFLEYAIPS